ncbi:hypothetical protein [Mycobacterium marseillense]|uniref:hypothetical protein n=1 Tax=Mycobacterium marseillense TaxID=701042 RepID=UPI0011A83A72|nr:hypothetical protein [Mycobacterium marseillense]
MRTAADKRTDDRRIGYLRLMLVSATTAGLIGLGVGVAHVHRPAGGRPCPVPSATTQDASGVVLSCSPARTGDGEAMWQYVAAH